MNTLDAKRVLETALICSHQPLPVRELRVLFQDALGADTIKTLLEDLQQDWMQRGVELVEVAGVQPLRAEFDGEPADAGIGDHASGLGGEGVGFDELA